MIFAGIGELVKISILAATFGIQPFKYNNLATFAVAIIMSLVNLWNLCVARQMIKNLLVAMVARTISSITTPKKQRYSEFKKMADEFGKFEFKQSLLKETLIPSDQSEDDVYKLKQQLQNARRVVQNDYQTKLQLILELKRMQQKESN